jgi:hypothetical protein
MESRSFRVGSDGLIHSALRDQLAANPLHNLSYAQNVGYALPGFRPTVSSSESIGQDSILKGWQYLSASGVSSLNVPNAGSSSTAYAASTTAFPGLNHRVSSASTSASTAAAAAAAAVASAAAVRSQKESRLAFTTENLGRIPEAPLVDASSEPHQRSTATQFRLSMDLGSQLQMQQNPLSHHPPAATTTPSSYLMRAAVTAPLPSKPWSDFVPGGDVGAAAAAAASSQLQHTLAASHHSNIRRASASTSGVLLSSHSGRSTDRVTLFPAQLTLFIIAAPCPPFSSACTHFPALFFSLSSVSRRRSSLSSFR